MNYEQFLAKHANSPKWQLLSKAEKKSRYQSYLNSGGNPKYARKSAPQSTGATAMVPKGQPSGGKGRGKSAYAALCQALGVQLSPATHDYLTALYNPFCPRVAGNVGYPDGAPGGSHKCMGFSAFNVVTNAAGFGFVNINPVACGASNILGISYSALATYAQTVDAFPASAAATGVVNTSFGSGIPYSTASVGASNLMWRLVACGIRVRSTQAMLSKQASIKTICLPIADADLWSVTGQQILSDFRKYSHRYQGNEAQSPWFSAVWSPSAPSNGQFVRNLSPADVPAANTIYADLTFAASFGASGTGILISGAPSAVFECEVYGHYEYFGASVVLTGQQTPSFSDPIGVTAVQSLASVSSPIVSEKVTDGGASVSNLIGAAAQVGGAISKFLTSGSQPDRSSINGMTVSQMKAYLPSVPGAVSESVSEGSSLGGFLSDAAEMLPELLAFV